MREQGFAPEDIPHLFERFYRGKSAAKGGIGIGLALPKIIIERAGWNAWASNHAGGRAPVLKSGSTVTEMSFSLL